MTIRVTGPDGLIVNFPDGTDDKTINRVMSEAHYKAKKGDNSISVGDWARSFTSGIPFVGEFADEARSKVRSVLPDFLGGDTYEAAQAREVASRKQFEEESPVASTVLPIVGGVAGTVAALPVGAATAIGRTALGIGARTLPGNVARGATAGLLQGAAAGAGAADPGDSPVANRGLGAIQGGVVGGVAGGALPLAFEGIRRPIASGWQRLTGREDALSRLSGASRRYVEGISTPENLDMMEEGFRRLGPEAMPADVSPEWQGVAAGVAARPGSREEVINPLTERAARGGAEVRATMNRELGPAPVPSQVQTGIENQMRAVGEQYGPAIAQGTAVPTQNIAQRLEALIVDRRGPAQDALRQVRNMLNITGTDQLDPDPAVAHQVRQAIDGMRGENANPQVRQALGDARREIDALLEQHVPGMKDIDAQYAALIRQGEALERGQQVLRTDQNVIRPAELAEEIAANAQPGRVPGPSAVNLRLRQGTRAKLDEIVGTSGNDVQAIRRAIRGSEAEGDWNPQKLGMVFGQERARPVMEEVERRHTFQQTANQVVGGSPTAGRQAFIRALDALESPIAGPGANMPTLFGAAANTLGKLTTMMTGAIGAQRAQRFASELGRISVSQGVDRDQFVALMRRAGMNRAQIERAYRIATSGGLVAGRHAASSVTEAEQ